MPSTALRRIDGSPHTEALAEANLRIGTTGTRLVRSFKHTIPAICSRAVALSLCKRPLSRVIAEHVTSTLSSAHVNSHSTIGVRNNSTGVVGESLALYNLR